MAKRIAAIVGAIALTATSALLGASPAGAASHTYGAFTCDALFLGVTLHNVASPVPVTVNVSAPATVNSGDSKTISFPAGTNTLPASAMGASITSFQDMKMIFTISGSTFTIATKSGTATNNGSATGESVAVETPHTLALSWAGPLTPGNLVSAPVAAHTKAGAVGSTITITGTEFDATANLGVHPAVATCALPSDVLSSTTVLAPPPPGAPTVKSDSGTSKAGAPTTIDVLANDKSGAHKPDASTLKITTKPKHGTASVTSADKILYTPNAGYSGIDSFQYHVCTVGGGACAITAVNVSVTAAPPSTTTTTTTTMPVTTTTAAGPTLAHTGSASVPLSVIGFLASVLGAVAVAVFRPRRDYRLPQ